MDYIVDCIYLIIFFIKLMTNSIVDFFSFIIHDEFFVVINIIVTAMVITIVLAIIGLIFAMPFIIVYDMKQKKERARQKERVKRVYETIGGLADSTKEITPKEFIEMRNFSLSGKQLYALSEDFEGVYILHNKTKDMYYVGQGKKVFNRVNAHFTGKGNGDVYADYKYGDEFTIKFIALENSGVPTLNELERKAIAYHDSYLNGYNKTSGNRG